MNPLTQLVVHHSASPRSVLPSQIREWHLAKGWNDVGYHYLVTVAGSYTQAGRSTGPVPTPLPTRAGWASA